MLSTEIKVNSVLVGHLYAHNAVEVDQKGRHLYYYCYYSVQKKKVQEGQVRHRREDGLEKLISLIFQDLTKTKE